MFETAVIDASPLIILAKCDLLPLLRDIARQIVVPPAVMLEVAAGAENDPGRRALNELGIDQTGPVVIDERVAAHGMDAGETVVLSVAIMKGAAYIAIFDDAYERRC